MPERGPIPNPDEALLKEMSYMGYDKEVRVRRFSASNTSNLILSSPRSRFSPSRLPLLS